MYIFASIKFDEQEYPFNSDSNFVNMCQNTSNHVYPLGVYLPESSQNKVIFEQSHDLSALKSHTIGMSKSEFVVITPRNLIFTTQQM